MRVTRPARPVLRDVIETAYRLDTDLGELRLMGVDLSRTEAAPGDSFVVTLCWSADETPTIDVIARLSLHTAGGAEAAAFDVPPTSAAHPTTAWQAGDLWCGRHALHFPADLESGGYTLRLTLLPIAQSATNLPTTNLPITNLPITIHITAPPRIFTLPAPQHPLSITLGQQATLLGYDLSESTLSAGQPLTITLYWRAEATAATGYVIFVQLLDRANRIYAQSDRPPAAGTRRTTGWLSGEMIYGT